MASSGFDFALSGELAEVQAHAKAVATQGVVDHGVHNDSWINGFSKEFSATLGTEGWVGMTWPTEFGGGGRPPIERVIMAEEMISAGAPIAASWFADRQFGPSIYTYGTREQQEQYLPDMLAGSTSLPVAGHLTCVAADKDCIDSVVDGYLARGVDRIVALRGDAPADAVGCDSDGSHPDGYRDAADLVAGIRRRPDADKIDISVAAYPEVHPKAQSAKADMDNLKRKLDAGADRALTQFFFDTEVFLRFLDDARTAGITAPIVPGIMPVTNFAGICRFSERCGTKVPTWMHDLFADLDEAPEVRELVAATVAAEQCKLLIEHGVRDFHFYTMNKPNLIAATCRILGVQPSKSAQSETKAS